MIAHVRKYAYCKCDCWVQVEEDGLGDWDVVGDNPYGITAVGPTKERLVVLEPAKDHDDFTLYEDDDPAIPDWVWAELMKRALTCPES